LIDNAGANIGFPQRAERRRPHRIKCARDRSAHQTA